MSWNKQNYPDPEPLFTVANGEEDIYSPGTYIPKNLFEVHEDGAVIIDGDVTIDGSVTIDEPQGDISMGIFE